MIVHSSIVLPCPVQVQTHGQTRPMLHPREEDQKVGRARARGGSVRVIPFFRYFHMRRLETEQNGTYTPCESKLPPPEGVLRLAK